MKKNHLWVAIVQFIVLWISSHTASLADAPDATQKLVFCSEGSPESLAPSVSFSATSIDVYLSIYDTLVTYVRGETNLMPSLAEHWQVSKDGKEYTFFLQQGVKWHSNALFQPTRNFNADDVIFTIERQWKTSHPFYHVTSSNHAYFKSVGLGELIKSIEKINDYTVKFTLNEANAAFLSMLSLTITSVQSHEYGMAALKNGTPEVIDTQPIGTGPFSFSSYEKDKNITFKAFSSYWRGRAKIDELEFLISPDPDDRWQKIQKKICHVMPFPKPSDLDQIRKHPSVTVLEQLGLNVGYLAYNTKKVPFNDVRVRKALNMAINKQAILERVYQGRAARATTLIPSTMWSHNNEVKDDVFDPIAAKELLKEAGFPKGFSTELWAMSVARAYNPNPQLMAEMIQADLAAIGVKVKINSPDWSEYSKRMAQGEHEMGLYGWTAIFGDPDSFFYTLLSCDAAKTNGPNMAKFCNPLYDELVRRARIIADPTLRRPLYEDAQYIFKEQAPWLTIATSKQFVVVRNEVVNFRLSPFGRHLFYGVELKDIAAK
jgi:dipeptide transport system substrate-binding protein